MNELVQLQISPVAANTPGLTELEIGQLIKKLPGWETYKKKWGTAPGEIFPVRGF